MCCVQGVVASLDDITPRDKQEQDVLLTVCFHAAHLEKRALHGFFGWLMDLSFLRCCTWKFF